MRLSEGLQLRVEDVDFDRRAIIVREGKGRKDQMGGLANVQSFYRLFMVPGIGHSSPNGTANPLANPPLPAPEQLYGVLTNWVEKGTTPSSIVINSPSSTPVARSQPICAYPNKATYSGSGDPNAAANYTCS